MQKQATYYSLRQWSPYQGTLQIVEISGFRAVSRDGRRWQVQVRNEGIRFFTYGTWCADGSGNLIATEWTQTLVEALESHPALPFPANDNLELWLLDPEEYLPLALLRTMSNKQRPFVTDLPRWQSALPGKTKFVSSGILNRADNVDTQHIAHHELLERFISAAAGAFPSAQWFRRQEDGTGIGLEAKNIPESENFRILEANNFPPLLVREHWDEELFEEIVADYHSWQAPDLLTHESISSPVRDHLEHKACKSAQRIYDLRKVLPKIINKDMVNAAFVEAVLRQAVPA